MMTMTEITIQTISEVFFSACNHTKFTVDLREFCHSA